MEPRGEAHLSVETIARWLSRDLGHEEVLEKVVPHFLATCPRCRESYDEVRRLQREFAHWDERVVVFEGRQAPELLAELARWPFERQLSAVLVDERFQNWGLCQLLLRESFQAGVEEPARAVALAELAVRLAERLVEAAYGSDWVFDLRARAWAALGNALRVLGELWSAESAFRRAEEHLGASMTGDLHTRAEVIDLKGSLRRAQRRLDEAEALAAQALALYRESGDTQGVGAVLVKQAKILEERGEVEGALDRLAKAQQEIGEGVRGRLLLCVRHNQISLLITAGRTEEAQVLLPEVRRLSAELGNALDLLRLRWEEGRLDVAAGDLAGAESCFREVQREFFTRQMGYDAALVSLDLALLYLREGRMAELRALAVEIMPVFESHEVHREAMAALLMFQSAAQEERLTVALVRQLAGFLARECRLRR